MRYISTRGGMTPQPFSETLLEGLAPDGGLAVPEQLPQVDAETLERWRALTYPQLAAEVLGLFATDIPREDLARMTADAYVDFPDAVVPLRSIGDGITLVGLSEGPTLAFKDMAMQFLGQALDYVLERKDQVLNIVGATSGDTGSAAEHALRGKDRVSVFMLSPQGRMSSFQRAQMYSLDDANVHNIAVEGVFDDCQNLVKKLAGDLEFKRAQHLGAVNSINLGRIAAQVVYYFWAWLRVTDAVEPEFRSGFEVSFTVPSGNFGNILSGFFAKGMGVPIRRLVLAANENNVLDEFFRTGVYRPRSAADTHATSSPSMDISKASNLERFIFELVGQDPSRVADFFRSIDEQGFVDLSAEQPRFEAEFGVVSGTSTHADRLATIRSVHEASGEIIDPHTADGVKVAREFLETDVPMLVLETAKPQKFAETITEAIGVELEFSAELQRMLAAPQHVTEMADDEQALRAFVAANALH
ncbi:threonine synthase [Microbacterium arabinogalactanolyticum]|uniref:threonine synthase n=1 Tax=Microbacterium arabinogalactanolyticum TaxID=69365 RepID=UPI00255692EE|nr:threonine synthase [Microbacterium arabinogalactanolyticum]GLC85509.1 threonine synthase [Microbacterium arabinogalactanolyticum]